MTVRRTRLTSRVAPTGSARRPARRARREPAAPLPPSSCSRAG
jgi:hypothetical protein